MVRWVVLCIVVRRFTETRENATLVTLSPELLVYGIALGQPGSAPWLSFEPHPQMVGGEYADYRARFPTFPRKQADSTRLMLDTDRHLSVWKSNHLSTGSF